MRLSILSEEIMPDKVFAYLKHLTKQDIISTDDVLSLLKYMYGDVPSDKLHTQKEGIFDIYDYFSPKVDDKERLMNYVINLSHHPSWIAALVMYSNDLGDDYADRNYKFHSMEVFQNVLSSLLERQWGGLSVFIDRFLNSNMEYLEKMGESDPEILTELGAMLDIMQDDDRYEAEDFNNPKNLESIEQKYGSVLPRS